MLNNDTYTLLLMTKMRRDALSADIGLLAANQLKMTSLKKKKESEKHSRVVTFILHETGKALVSTGNRLLEIA